MILRDWGRLLYGKTFDSVVVLVFWSSFCFVQIQLVIFVQW
jgi:hypothetical protein